MSSKQRLLAKMLMQLWWHQSIVEKCNWPSQMKRLWSIVHTSFNDFNEFTCLSKPLVTRICK
jgi:hypothetical protein